MEKSWVSEHDKSRQKKADYVFDKNQRKEKKEYYNDFPTIWHLRKHLLETEEKADVRYIYLVLHHMFKHRGNFLYTNAEFQDTNKAVEEQLKSFVDYLNEVHGIEIPKKSFIINTKTILLNFNLSTAEKKEKWINQYKPVEEQKKIMNEFIKAVLGYKVNLHTLFGYTEEKVSLYLKEGVDDEKVDGLRDYLGVNEEALDLLVQIYSWGVMKKLLPGENTKYISSQMVKKYENYKLDLKELKELFEEYAPQNKNKFFKKTADKKEKNYYNYNKSKKAVTTDELYKTIDKLLFDSKDKKSDKRYQRYLSRKTEGEFLKVINTVDKGAIPHQLHKIELEEILKKQTIHYPFLKESTDKLKSILEFRIPYYVGPLNSKSKFAWVERSNQKIYPWTFDEVVYKEKSEENFIRRMISHCSYLTDQEALPLESLVYQEYILLNELNTVRINKRKLNTKEKKDAIEQLFKKYSSVTQKQFKQWLSIYFGENREYQVSGLADETRFNGSLSSWVTFTAIGFELTDSKEFEKAENIVKWGTIFSDSQTRFHKIRKEYPELKDKTTKKLAKLQFKGWGRLSYKLLAQLKFTLPNEKTTTILDRLRKTNENFMQIINNKEEGFSQQLEEEMQQNLKEGSLIEQINEMPSSPSIKKSVHQAMLLVKEITYIMKGEPKKIFLEFAREDKKNDRTNKRYTQLKNIYDVLQKENTPFVNSIVKKDLLDLKNNSKKLNNEKLFLYFIQQGRCLYSGKELDINSFNDYEVDHILPRSYIKDDSLSNKALVLRTANQRKKDDMLLEKTIITNQRPYWEFLLKKGLISSKKFHNLTRDRITLEAKKGFINRQLVETRQISKHVKNLLNNNYPNTKVQTIKAQFSSNYRKENKLYKIRSLNDYHHAHDAYLSVYLGEFIDKRLPHLNNYSPMNYQEYNEAVEKMYENKKVFNKKNESGLLNLIYSDSDKVGWNAKGQNEKVKQYLNYKDCFVTYKTEENTGEFYNQLAIKAKSKGKKVPIKKGLEPTIYGGYTGQNSAYFVLVKNKDKIKAIPIPVKDSYLIKNKQNTIKKYLLDTNINGEVIRSKVLPHALVEYHGHLHYMSSYTERTNARQLTLPSSLNKFLWSTEKRFNYSEKSKDFELLLNEIIKKLEYQFSELSSSQKLKEMIEVNFNDLVSLDSAVIDEFVSQLLKFFQANAQNPSFNIPHINELKNKKRVGRMNSQISNWAGSTIVDQSITGVYEKRTHL